ncbi:MAG: hypothetical protein HZA04_04825 [Nitrospinae bacterium]|nr:hypothetical protein [Nitrospinota bacterium]
MFAIAIILLSASITAHAGGITLKAGEDRFIQIGYRLQVLTQIGQNQAGAAAGDPTVSGDHTDLYLRRSRLLVGGQAAPGVNFFLQLADDNRGKSYAASTGVKTLDGWIELDSGTAGKVMAGIFPVQFSRSRLTSPFSSIALDRAAIDELQLDSTALDGKRDRGLLLWGNIGGFQYRLAAGKGAKPQETGAETIRYHGRVHISLMDGEEDFLYKESYQGGKDIFTIGYGFDRQDKASTDVAGKPAGYSAWTADVAMEGRTESGVMSLVGAYYSYDWSNPGKKDSSGNYVQGKGWQATLAWMSMEKQGGIQPYARYVVWDAESASSGASQRSTALGFNYLLSGFDAKLVFDFEQISFPTEGATWDRKNHSVTSMQWQISF